MLIGFMATGKSTVGRLVAERTRRRFVDLDRAIEERSAMSVTDIFRAEGEPGFRAREAEALHHALAEDGVVLATGGGAACREDNLSAMLARGFVVALSAPVSEVLARAAEGRGRPLLDHAADPSAVAARLLAEREPFYARAHFRADTAGRSPESVAAEIVTAFHETQVKAKKEI